MDKATIIALAGMISTLAAALFTNFINSRTTLKTKKLEILGKQQAELIIRREAEYGAFLEEATAQAIAAYGEKSSDIRVFTKLSSHAARIQLHSKEIGALAFEIASHIVSLNGAEKNELPSEEDITFSELRNRFVAMCREDMEALKNEI